jgi:protein-tyrosine phosphatase
VLDLHAHILPGIDDGPRDVQGSVEMARAAVAAGLTTMAATPHIDHTFMVDPRSVPGMVAELRKRLAAEDVRLDVVQGGELALHRLLELDDEQLAGISLGRGRHLLVEPPFASPVPALEKLVFTLQSRGHGVLLAHPERCAATADVDRAATLVERGALIQVTAGSLLGQFGGTVRRTALEMLARGLVHVLASDAHAATGRSMDLGRALESVEREVPGISSHLEYLTRTAPAAILDGAPVPHPPPLPGRRWDLRGRLRGN